MLDRSIDSSYGCEKWVWSLVPGDRIAVWDEVLEHRTKRTFTVDGPWYELYEYRVASLPCINDETGLRVNHVMVQELADLISKADGSSVDG